MHRQFHEHGQDPDSCPLCAADYGDWIDFERLRSFDPERDTCRDDFTAWVEQTSHATPGDHQCETLDRVKAF